MKVSINSPKTPLTEGSRGVSTATVPNVCKMPGPPAPFVPTPLPNIARTGNGPSGYTKTVEVEGKRVAVKGCSFESTGDVASAGTGGGIVSATTQGKARIVSPGSMNVQMEGKAVHLLGDMTTNNE
jgi:uncharacterized Zn-binding protein involved in type VI secretion